MSLKLAPFFLYDNFVFSLSVFIIHLGQELILFPWKAIAQSHPDLFCLYVTYLPAFIPSQGWRSTYCPDLFLCAWLAWSFDFQRNTLDREIDVSTFYCLWEVSSYLLIFFDEKCWVLESKVSFYSKSFLNPFLELIFLSLFLKSNYNWKSMTPSKMLTLQHANYLGDHFLWEIPSFQLFCQIWVPFPNSWF